MENIKKTMPSPEEIQKKLQIIDDLFKNAYQKYAQEFRIKFPELSQREINHMAYAQIEKDCQ